MAKLYAEITSNDQGRIASKSDNNRLVTRVWYKNKVVAVLDVLDNGQTLPHIKLTKYNS